MSREAAKIYQTALEDKAREDLVVSNLGFVRHVLGRLVGRLPSHVDLDNLEGAGVLGLVEASHQYDPARDVSFRSFAYARVWGAIVDEMRRNSPLPQKLMNRITKVHRAQETMKPPITAERLAYACDLTVDEVEACLQAAVLSNPTSLGEHIAQLGNARREQPVDARLQHEEMVSQLADCIERLPEKERLVVTMYYSEDLRLKEIGEVLNLSESRVSRILNAAETRLKEMVAS